MNSIMWIVAWVVIVVELALAFLAGCAAFLLARTLIRYMGKRNG